MSRKQWGYMNGHSSIYSPLISPIDEFRRKKNYNLPTADSVPAIDIVA